MTVATTTTLDAPLEETLAFVGYHLRMGIDRMFLFFDDPDDDAIPILEDHDRLVCVRCDGTHWERHGVESIASVQERQKANATQAFWEAREDEIDWVVHVDSDEFLYLPESTKHYFSTVSSEVEVLLFPVMEAVPQRMRYRRPFREISLFKYYPQVRGTNDQFRMAPLDRGRYSVHSQLWRRKKQVATVLGCDHSHVVGRYLPGHMAGKAATRTTASVVGLENHRPVPCSGEVLRASVTTDAAVLHFDCRGFPQWKSKWARRVEGMADFDVSRFSPHRKRQLRRFQDAYSRDDDQALKELYKSYYFIPDYERMVMKGLGLVKEINLSFSLDGMKAF